MSNALKPPVAVEVVLAVTEDEEGGYSAVALNLPGAGSCGETAEEAVENAREALAGVLEAYEEIGGGVPWREVAPSDVPAGARLERITLHV